MNNSVWEVWIDFGIKVKEISRLFEAGKFSCFWQRVVLETCSLPCVGRGLPWLVQADSARSFSTLHSVTSTWLLEISLSGIFTPSKLAAATDQSSSLQTWLLDFLPAHHCLYSTPNILPIPLTHTLTHSQQARRPVCCVCINTQRITYVHVPLTASLDVSNPPCSVLLLSLVFFYLLHPDPRQWSLSLTHSWIHNCSLPHVMRPSVSQRLSTGFWKLLRQ